MTLAHPSSPLTLESAIAEHGPKLLRMISQRIPSTLAARVDPEEILQKAFMKAQKAWARLEASGMKPYVWLYRIVLDTLHDERDWNYCRQRDLRREIRWPEGSSLEVRLGLMDPASTPSGKEERKEVHDRVRHVLARLRPEDREMLCLRYFDELSREDVAQLLDVSVDTVRGRFARARLRFKNLWKDLYGLDGAGE